jgi:hypothetical protein
MDGITPSPRRARQRHDGGRRSRHVSDPQPGLGGACRLEAAHSVPPEIRKCDRRSAKLTQPCRPFPDKFGLPLRFAARTAPRHHHAGTSRRQRTGDGHRTGAAPPSRRGTGDGRQATAVGRPYSAPDTGQPRQRTGQPRAAICRAIARSPTKRAVSAVAQNVAQTLTRPPTIREGERQLHQ